MSRHGRRSRLAPAFSLALSLAALSACTSGGDGTAGPPSPSPRGRPTGASTALVVDAAGGTVTSPDANLAVTIPPGALAGPTDITIVEITNTAPGGVGTAYRVGPVGLVLATPAALTFTVPAAVTVPVSDLAVSNQPGSDPSGFWVRVPNVTRDGAARTLAVAVEHFGDWALTTSTTTLDLNGPVQITSTLDVPFTASGWATLNHAGGDASLTYYVAGGSLTIQEPVAYDGGACTAAAPAWALFANVATFAPASARLEVGLSGLWDLACTGGASSGVSVSFALDTVGISHYECPQGYVGTPVLTGDQMVATYRVDCGARGYLEARWDLVTCTSGVACATNPNTCVLGTTSCATGRPVCVDTTDAKPPGTSCGTDQVCNAGTCVACVAGAACTDNPNPCVDGVTSCATGEQVCTDTTTAKTNGTACGTDQVCNGGICSACVAGGACSTNPNACVDGVLSCATGSQTCTDTAVQKLNGTSCGVDQVCNLGVCSACAAGGTCSTNPNACVAGAFSCETGTQACVNTSTPTAAGGTCGTDLVCDGAGACVACAANQACQNPTSCFTGLTSCATGAQTCDNTATPRAAGESCGTDQVCDGTGTCVACTAGLTCQNPGSCFTGLTSCATGAQTCVDTTTPAAPGTACGSDQACDGAGTCVACAAGQACQNPTSCFSGLTSCATGAQTCVDTPTPRGVGATCGTDQVCDATNACVACAAGQGCQNPPSCFTGLTSCATGAQTCADTATPRGAGETCGADQVCDGVGVCVACTSGQGCQLPGSCFTGATSCATGAQTCADTSTPLAPGVTCGVDLVCDGTGSCVACTAGLACASNPNVCVEGVTSCGTGAQTCVDGATPTNEGGACGTGGACTGGTCVEP